MNGSSIIAYAAPSGSSCSSESRLCTDGILNGTYTYPSCSVTPPPPANCVAPWGGVVTHNASILAYATSSSTTCSSENRVCNNGTLSGSYTYPSCTLNTPPPANCTTPWGSVVANGSSVLAYLASSSSTSCTSENRTCNNGSLSGSYKNSSCTVSSPPPPVTCGPVTVATPCAAKNTCSGSGKVVTSSVNVNLSFTINAPLNGTAVANMSNVKYTASDYQLTRYDSQTLNCTSNPGNGGWVNAGGNGFCEITGTTPLWAGDFRCK